MNEPLKYRCECGEPATWFLRSMQPNGQTLRQSVYTGTTTARAACDEHLVSALKAIDGRFVRVLREPNKFYAA